MDEIRRYLHALAGVQDELDALLRNKRAALTTGDAPRLVELARDEAALVDRLQALLRRRAQILERAAEVGVPAPTLEALASRVAGDEFAQLEPEFARLRRRAGELRRESWVHWIIAQRSYHHYTDLLEIFAHRGEAPPVYERSRQTQATGGGLIDASA